VLALADAPRAGRGHGLSPAVEAKIVQLLLGPVNSKHQAAYCTRG
jgi:hypothetical protein